MSTSLRPFSLLAVLCATSARAQAPFIPVDCDGDTLGSPVMYIQNLGQKLNTELDPADEVKYYTRGANPMIFAQEKGVVSFAVARRDTAAAPSDTVLHVALWPVGEGSAAVDPIHLDTLPPLFNFYRPDIAPGIEDVIATSRVVYKEIYDGIDWHLYGGRSGAKMAFMCKPHSDPTEIMIRIDGVDSLHIDVQGWLRMYISGRWIYLNEAKAYQVYNGTIVSVNWIPSYITTGGFTGVRFNFDSYDHNLPLILQIGPEPPPPGIDPSEPRNMGWCTYAGGNDADEFMAADVDNNGDVYACGYAYEQNFPVATGLQVFPSQFPNLMGSEDAVVMKFQAADKRIAWANFIGGSAVGTSVYQWKGLDKAYDIAVYKGSNTDLEYAFVTGSTMSGDFPTGRNSTSPFASADLTYVYNPLQYQAAWIAALKQDNGHLHWATTHGMSQGASTTWVCDGLAVDVDEDGTLIWGGRISENAVDPQQMSYPYVTPTGAYTRANGGGFFTLFDSDYQVLWRTPFGSRGSRVGLFDAKIGVMAGHKKAFITGTTTADTDPYFWPLDVYQPSGWTGFYQNTPGGGIFDAYVAVLDLDTYQRDYCSYWGGSGQDMGIAIEVVNTSPHGYKNFWVGGLTYSDDLDATHLPDPATGYHNDVPGGDADGFVLAFVTQPEIDLDYGTLIGGAGPDAVLDIERAAECGDIQATCKLYITGETASDDGILIANDNSLLYRQEVLGNFQGSDRRDGFLIALGSLDKAAYWSSYIGGFNTDKGWGLAAAQDELFLVGGTVSPQGTFPLKEFDPGSPLDWYDADLLNNVGAAYWGYYSFSAGYYNTPFAGTPTPFDPWPGWSHDAFIASFGISTNLSVAETVTSPALLVPGLLDANGLWGLTLPQSDQWTVSVFDATGRLVDRSITGRTRHAEVDLRQRAAGVYAVTCLDQAGHAYGAKLLRP